MTMLAAPIQKQFPFAAVEKHSLAGMKAATWWLELNAEAVLDLIAVGELAAFNLAGHGADRRLPGIWSVSLHNYRERQRCGFTEPAPAWDEDEIIHDILPPGGKDLRFSQLRRALGIERRLLHDLIEDGLLVAVAGTGNTVNKSPTITRASVVAFLEGRRI